MWSGRSQNCSPRDLDRIICDQGESLQVQEDLGVFTICAAGRLEETMEIAVLFAILVAVFLYVMIRGAVEEKSRRKRYRRQLAAPKMISTGSHGMIWQWTMFLRA